MIWAARTHESWLGIIRARATGDRLIRLHRAGLTKKNDPTKCKNQADKKNDKLTATVFHDFLIIILIMHLVKGGGI